MNLGYHGSIDTNFDCMSQCELAIQHLYQNDSMEYSLYLNIPLSVRRNCMAVVPGAGKPPIFLDRDGTIICEVDFLSSPTQVRLIPGVAAAIRRLNRAQRPVIVVTNQPVIAMGKCSERDLAQIHARLKELLASEGAQLDAIYYCPHDPCARTFGGVVELQIECDCRKPKTGMILRAAADFGLDLTNAWLIGDKTVDIRTARNAALRSGLVLTGHGGRDGKYADAPDEVFDALPDAVAHILGPVTEQ
jgi:histidinol-phosphate phosphatase family protein